jgi:enolase
LKQIDETVATLPDIEPSEALALSVAAARGAAKFKGVKLYEYFSELAGLKEEEVCIPAPVPALAAVNIPSLNTYRTIQLFPVKASNYELAVAKLHGFFHKLSHVSDKFTKPIRYSPLGTPSTDLPTIEEVIKVSNLSCILFKKSI